MEHPQPDRDVGSSIPIPAILASVVALALIVGGFYGYRMLSGDQAQHEIVVATGPETGTYHALGEALARVLEGASVVESAEVRSTGGSVENMERIDGAGGGADLAFVQSDTPIGNNARLVTPLYNEVLHILVSRLDADEIRSVYDLRGRRVSLGPAGSGTRQLSKRVLDHFGAEVGEDLALLPAEATAGLIDGSVDAAFILSAIPSRMVTELAEKDAIRFLSLGDAQEFGNESDALALVFPSIRGTTIPRSTYVRLPEEPVQTIEVSAMLIARRGLGTDLVRTITATIFERRLGSAGLEEADLAVVRRIREDYRPGSVTIPYHRGAVAYYHREEPAFFVEYAEAISLGLTLLVGLYSGYIALREWMRRRMKNRIDAYLLEVESQTADLASLSLEKLIEHRDALDEVRHRAFSDLVSERLLADESFTIFQNHLRDEFTAIEARIQEKTASG
ncbi:MAG: TAXI family TRAP transporter solute-binding subunit [Acidobacteria bacterium]|nr:TAXI family TRAP transporter solute-binding subunit [Candidatus Sulfomarinibacter sp. MAG AM1]